MSAVVYFARSRRTGLVKIGRTERLKKRLYELSRLDGGPLDLLSTIKTGDPCMDEYYVHSVLDAKRVSGEWFQIDAPDIAHASSELGKMHVRWAAIKKEAAIREEAKRVRRMKKWAEAAGLKLSEVIA